MPSRGCARRLATDASEPNDAAGSTSGADKEEAANDEADYGSEVSEVETEQNENETDEAEV